MGSVQHPLGNVLAGNMKTVKQTGIVIDPRHAGHCMGPEAPECPARLDRLVDLLQEPELKACCVEIDAAMAVRDDLARVHSKAHIDRLEATAGKPATYLDEDTRTSSRSNEVARMAAGGLCRAITAVCAGRVANAFALIRPPGHHAGPNKTGGFCLYNNVAIAARYAQNKLGLARILVVDWDLHHGNGTQSCFEDDPTVLFISIHQAFTFPHSGSLNQVGKGRGRGYTVNIPLPAGLGDGEYLELFGRLVSPVALAFHPELILVSAGFDAHADDPLGRMRVTPAGFAGMTRMLMDVADRCCHGRLVLSLEGGYHLAGLKESVGAVLRELSGRQTTHVARLAPSGSTRKTDYIVWRVGRVHGRYWPCLKQGAADLPFIDRLRGMWERWAGFFKG
jgi:acetoin utilization deacetylase AcuC-like enzyme